MKKISILVMVFILVSSIIPVTYADDTGDAIESDAKTQGEIECMRNQTGAAIRLLQLEKAITGHIAKGDAVVDVLQMLEYNTTSLEAILVEFELLLAEVQTADPNATDAVQVFVDLKSDAIELTKEFRETVHFLVDEETKEMLRDRVQDMICEQAQNLSIMIKNQIRQYNRNQLYRLYGMLGETNLSFLDEYQKDNITWGQVRIQMKTMVNNMTQERRNELFGKLKESNIRTRIQSQVYLENVTEGFQTRKDARLTLRLQLGQNVTEGDIRSEFVHQIMNRMHKNTDDGSDTSGQHSGGSYDNDTSGNGNGYNGSQVPGGGQT